MTDPITLPDYVRARTAVGFSSSCSRRRLGYATTARNQCMLRTSLELTRIFVEEVNVKERLAAQTIIQSTAPLVHGNE